MTATLEKEFDELEGSYVVDLKRSQTLGKLATDAKTVGAGDRSREIGYEALAFFPPPIHPLSRRKDLKMRFYNLTDFPKEAIDHFETRARSSTNSLVVARFADIVWEARRNVIFAKLALSAYLDSVEIQKHNLADDRLHRLIDLTDAVQRAVEIAVSLTDPALAARAEKVCVELFVWLDSVKEYRWGLEIIEALLEMKKFASRDSVNSAYGFGEWAFKYLTHQSDENFKIQVDYATLLARLATSLGDSNSAERWRKEVPAIFAREAGKAQYKGLAASISYQRAAKAYLDVGMKKESDEMLALSIKMMQEVKFHKIEIPIEIPREVVDREVKKYTENKSPAEILLSISSALELVPDHDCALDMVKKTGGISSIIPVGLYEGTRRIASAATPDEIFQARTSRQFATNCEVSCSLLLIPLLDKAIELGCSKEAFINHFRSVQGLNSDRIELLGVGVERFLSGDYVSCIHILVIQIEAWLRDILESMGGHTTYVKDQIVLVRTIDSVLNDELIKAALATRLWKYVNAIMNDDLAFGLRDKVAHGLCEASEFNRNKATLLVHICLLLTNIPPKPSGQRPLT